jgi:hypothetical protein
LTFGRWISPQGSLQNRPYGVTEDPTARKAIRILPVDIPGRVDHTFRGQASGIEDLKAATEVEARETGQEPFHFFVESLGAFTYTGLGSPTNDHARRI